jgi:hypothetical protein
MGLFCIANLAENYQNYQLRIVNHRFNAPRKGEDRGLIGIIDNLCFIF